jgi:protein-tyrosine phosphatase
MAANNNLQYSKVRQLKMYKFAPAWENEQIAFGAARPGYTNNKVQDWIDFMKYQNIKRVCCILTAEQLAYYSKLLDTYKHEFGNQLVCWAPIADFHLCDLETLTQKILPFLIEADKQNEKVVVHCSGGIGRTGYVLAAWLVSIRGLSNQAAIAAVKRTGRNPYEAAIAAVLKGRNPLKVVKELDVLLNDCRLAMYKVV